MQITCGRPVRREGGDGPALWWADGWRRTGNGGRRGGGDRAAVGEATAWRGREKTAGGAPGAGTILLDHILHTAGRRQLVRVSVPGAVPYWAGHHYYIDGVWRDADHVRDCLLRNPWGCIQLLAAGWLGVMPGGLHPRDIWVRADIRQLHRTRRPGERLERPEPAVTARPRLPAHRTRAGGWVDVFPSPHIPQREGVWLPAAPKLHRVPEQVLRGGLQLPVLLQPRRTVDSHHWTGPSQEH